MKKEIFKKVIFYETKLTLDTFMLDQLDQIGMELLTNDRQARIEYAVNHILKEIVNKNLERDLKNDQLLSKKRQRRTSTRNSSKC